MWRLVFVATLTACNSLFGIHDLPADGATGSDSAGSGDASLCYGRGALAFCVSAAPTQPVALPDDIDTDTSTLCQTVDVGGVRTCVIAATSMTTTLDVRAHGSRPLVLLASADLTIPATLDASSHNASAGNQGQTGPGVASTVGQPNNCASGNGGNGGASIGGGGGGGGSFGSAGGTGGTGQGTMTPGGSVGAKATPPTTLRAGCAGGNGGDGSNTPGSDGPGGPSGGVVYLVAGGAITIDGAIDASGAGGEGGNVNKGGGGGGGSGGMIVVDGASIAGTGSIFTNGGGGGAGADMGTHGGAGADPTSATMAAAGGTPGNGVSCGSGPGCGGNGAAADPTGQAAAQNGQADVTGAGGGGGGGGLGYVLLPPNVSFTTTSGTISHVW